MNDTPERTGYPSFIIGGAAKSGTTSLSRYLSEHPGLYLPKQEANFFTYVDQQPEYRVMNHPFVRDIDSYLDLLYPFEMNGKKIVIGEKSVSYLYKGYYQQVIRNIKKYHPYWRNLKWIFILRHPVERAYSQYIHNRNFHEDLSFREAISRWPERKDSGWIPAYDYLGAGFYSKPIRSFLENFNQVRIYLFEDLTQRPAWMLDDILAWLEITTPNGSFSFDQYNRSGIPKNKLYKFGYDLLNNIPFLKKAGSVFSPGARQRIKHFTHQKPPLPAGIKQELNKYYQNDIRELEKLIQRDLSGWYKQKVSL